MSVAGAGRSYANLTHVLRASVPEHLASWSSVWPDYQPPDFTSDKVVGRPWADPAVLSADCRWNEDGRVNRRSHCGSYQLITLHDGSVRPLNPRGRTGIAGRGLLGRWGPNHAADALLSRWKRHLDGGCEKHASSGRPLLQLLVIQRADCGLWALPGGMVDPGETAAQAAIRELLEEAVAVGDRAQQLLPAASQQLLETGGRPVFAGYVDDPRNTDHSWMETTALSFHDHTGGATGGACLPQEGASNADDIEVVELPIAAGSDATHVRWVTVSRDTQLYASHGSIVKMLADLLHAHW